MWDVGPETETEATEKAPPGRAISLTSDEYVELVRAGDTLARQLNRSPGIDFLRGHYVEKWNEAKSAIQQAATRTDPRTDSSSAD